MAEQNDAPNQPEELDDLQRAENMLQESIPSLAANAQKQQLRSARIDYWLQSSIAPRRRHWWQFWKR